MECEGQASEAVCFHSTSWSNDTTEHNGCVLAQNTVEKQMMASISLNQMGWQVSGLLLPLVKNRNCTTSKAPQHLHALLAEPNMQIPAFISTGNLEKHFFLPTHHIWNALLNPSATFLVRQYCERVCFELNNDIFPTLSSFCPET